VNGARGAAATMSPGPSPRLCDGPVWLSILRLVSGRADWLRARGALASLQHESGDFSHLQSP
jgi:hypothetical protein